MKSTTLTLLLILALLVSAAAIIFPVQAEAQTIIVPDDYSTIQAAVNAASAGDTVFVRTGIYEEQTLRINKPLSLTGENAVTTWINLTPRWIEYEDPIPFDWSQISQYEEALDVEADDVMISGFTINRTNPGIGGFCVLTGSRIDIIGNIILNDVFHFSGSYNVFALNTVMSTVEFFGGGYNTVAGNTVIGGSIWIGVSSSANVIYGNTVIDNSGGIAVGGNENIVTNNTVRNSNFGVSAAADASNNTFYLNVVINNTVGLRIAGEGGNNTFFANYVANNSFGAEVRYYFLVGDNNTFYHNNFVDNAQQVNTDPIYVMSEGEQWTAYHAGYFDSGKEGNYWSDYDGRDDNGDGKGDAPYVIDANRQDNFPLIAPFDIYSLNIELPEWGYLLPSPLPPPLPLPSLEPTPSEEPTPTSMPTPTPIPTPTATPTTTPELSPSPEPQLSAFPTIPFAIASATAVAVVVSLMVYFKNRKNHN